MRKKIELINKLIAKSNKNKIWTISYIRLTLEHIFFVKKILQKPIYDKYAMNYIGHKTPLHKIVYDKTS